MKSTGIVRNVDPLGRIVIPKEIRRTFNINEQDPMEIYMEGDKIILKKYEASEDKKRALNHLKGFQKHAIHFEDKEAFNEVIQFIERR